MKRWCLFGALMLGALFFCTASYFLFEQIYGDFPHQDIDSKAYLFNAKLLCENGSFAWPATADKKYPYYTLGYPCIIALLFKLFGDHDVSIILFQILLSLLCALLVFDITRKFAGNRSGIIAFLLICCNIGFLTFAQFILAEISLVFFLILFFHRFLFFLNNQGSRALVQAAIALSISVIIKPAALYFWPLLIPCFWVKGRASICSFVRLCVLWCIAFYLPLAGYALHNKITFDRWYVCALDQENMMYWFFPNVLAAQNHSDQNVERVQLRSMTHEAVTKKFAETVKQSPHLFVIVWLKNVAKTWLGLFVTNLKVLVEPAVRGGDISFFKTSGSLVERMHVYINAGTQKGWLIALGYFEFLWSLIRFVLCFVGIGLMIARRKMIEVYTVVTFLGYFSLITGHDGCARFRMMFEWLLLMMAALGLYFILSKLLKQTFSKRKQCS